MNFYHNFGSFHESVKVDGVVYTFEEYKDLARDARIALREEAVARCYKANQKLRAEQAATNEARLSVDGNTYPAAVHDIFRTWEVRVETPLERFERLVKHHDWYYNYSDDHRVWASGNRVDQKIHRLMDQLGPDAVKLYNQYCPWMNEDGTQKEHF